jgi:hypothetical protein
MLAGSNCEALVIFRYLHRRRVTHLFGRYLNPDVLDALCGVSEWQALKSFLPLRWRLRNTEKYEAVRREVARLAREALATSPEERTARIKEWRARRADSRRSRNSGNSNA